MSWLELKLTMLPSISNEIKSKIREFNQYVEDIDHAADRGEPDTIAMQYYSRLRA